MEENKNELESKKLDENLVGETYGGYGHFVSGGAFGTDVTVERKDEQIKLNRLGTPEILVRSGGEIVLSQKRDWNTDTKGGNGSTLGGGSETGNGSIFG